MIKYIYVPRHYGSERGLLLVSIFFKKNNFFCVRQQVNNFRVWGSCCTVNRRRGLVVRSRRRRVGVVPLSRYKI